MRCLKVAAIGFLITVCLAMPSSSLGGKRTRKVVEGWLQTMKETEASLEAGNWEKAKRDIEEVIEDMSGRIKTGDSEAKLLGTATLLRSLSQAGLGNEDAAHWDYDVAEALMPELSKVDLDRFGTAGQQLETWRAAKEDKFKDSLKMTGGPSVGGSPPQDITPPKKLRADAPQFPFGKRAGCIDGVVIVQGVVDERGLVTQPRLMTDQDPLLSYAALEAVRNWRFEPARIEGKPVPVFYHLTINFKLPSCSPSRG